MASGSSLMSPQVAFSFLLEGIKSNFLGLACPSYCQQPSIGLIGFSFFVWHLGWSHLVPCLWILDLWLPQLLSAGLSSPSNHQVDSTCSGAGFISV